MSISFGRYQTGIVVIVEKPGGAVRKANFRLALLIKQLIQLINPPLPLQILGAEVGQEVVRLW
jgi:hypothetical protein